MNSAPENTKRCLNCETSLSLHDHFCPYCGQKANIGRITFRETLSSFLSSAFAIEGPFFKTVRELIKNPGKVYRDYLSGKRKPYYKPVAFFILMTAVYLVIRSVIDFDPLEGRMVQIKGKDIPATVQRAKEASRFMVKNINNIMFFLVFSIGLSLKMFFRKVYNLAEYTTIGFYISGIYILFGTITMIISTLINMSLHEVQLFVLFLLIIYSAASLLQRRSILDYLKFLLASVTSILLYMFLGYGFSFFMVSVLTK